ncbi:hypothetical protein [Pseudoclavibacter albus]|uniref:hypothetical protein n=1 Tax=Pseudoclavibacter albus TaxID=272241 RepID=UPI000825EC6C|nr:hypothetical protein [Pseudoclavibacter alba]
MSATARLTKNVLVPVRDLARPPRLSLMPTPARRGLPRWMLTVGGVIGAVLVAQLSLTIALSQGAYETDELEAQQVHLQRTETALEEQLATVESPQNLTAQAGALGLAQASEMHSINESTGQVTVVGGPNRAKANPQLVGNQALNPTQPNAANPNVVPAAPLVNGVSSQGAAAAPVPSVSELASPTTR